MIPFRLDFQPGLSLYEQVVHAAKRAIVSGRLRPGDAFPSVRALSRELKINPNTAHKVVAELISEGVLEVHPGIGTLVAAPRRVESRERLRLIQRQLEELVVESHRLGLDLDGLTSAITDQWNRLTPSAKGTRK